MDGSTVLLADAMHSSALVDASGPAFGLAWENDFEPGVIPEYYVETPIGWQPIKVEDVPRETWLVDQTFAPATDNFFPPVNTAANSPWAPAKWAAGPFSVALGDGSIVEYVWYRFVDQPAIARLGLGQEELDRLQAFAESFHAASGLDGVSFDSPLSGTLIAIDPAHFVTPPAGLEVGYVPLVISQH
jgi:hypothetical protein